MCRPLLCSVCLFIVGFPTSSLLVKAYCPPIYGTSALTDLCDSKNCTRPPDLTKAMFQCTKGYENLDQALNPISFCRNVSWDYPIPRCGKKSVKTRNLGTQEATESNYPWQVGIYNKKKVHCIANVTSNIVFPAKNYEVAFGKYYRRYGDFMDRNVSNLKTDWYAGDLTEDLTGYIGDIAMLVAVREFVLNGRVLVICVDYALNNNSYSLSEEGLITGWGCTSESICAVSRSRNKTVCKGDSGGSLVFENKGDGRYYVKELIRIIQESSLSEICSDVTLYAKISEYINFINDMNDSFAVARIATEPKVPPRRDQCLLPQHPKFGYWTITNKNNGNLQPGDPADNGTSLEIKCNHPENYTLIGQTHNICKDGVWSSNFGQCAPLCPPIYSTPTMTVWCDGIENCTRPINLSNATFQCANYYEDLNLTWHPTRICKDGSWDLPIPKCDVACGQKRVKVQTLIIEGEDAIKGDYPWQVAIYNQKKILICGGSLITQKLVLSAAHCVTSFTTNKVFPAENYEVAVGKYYRNYRDSRDRHAQYSKVSNITISSRYKGITLKYVGDIAILVAVNKFILSEQVLPICVDYGGNRDPSNYWEQGVVTGWGYTTDSAEPSEVLKELYVPRIDDNECRAALPMDFAQKYLSFDKICAGFHNQSKAVCKGDSGGPLAFKNKKDGRYYVQGIVSLSPRFSNKATVGVCSSQNYAVYTKVSEYVRFIANVKAVHDYS